MNRPLNPNTPTLGIPLGRTNMLIDQIEPFNQYLILGRNHLHYLTGRAFVVTGDYLYHITFFYMSGHN
jgi:hypothetical protein